MAGIRGKPYLVKKIEHIVYTAKKSGIAGATVLKGIMGFGSSSEIYSDKLWEIGEKIPL